MNLEGTLDGIGVSIPMPDPDALVQDGVWYEVVSVRRAKRGELTWNTNRSDVNVSEIDTENIFHILRPIPKPTPEELARAGYELDGDKPREVTDESVIWFEGGTYSPIPDDPLLCKRRWHLRRAQPKPVERVCETCGSRDALPYVWPCIECDHYNRWHAKGTPPPPRPDATPTVDADADALALRLRRMAHDKSLSIGDVWNGLDEAADWIEAHSKGGRP